MEVLSRFVYGLIMSPWMGMGDVVFMMTVTILTLFAMPEAWLIFRFKRTLIFLGRAIEPAQLSRLAMAAFLLTIYTAVRSAVYALS